MASGLYKKLAASKLLVEHDEVRLPPPKPSLAYKVIEPTKLAFISYPYEWCFSQLKSAALCTLRIQKLAMVHSMSLKDASAYNVQFLNGVPILIDTLSFETYEEGKPWVAYRQFCQHFLAPLALMAKTDIRLSQLLRVYIDGIPLDLAASLLPRLTRINFGLLAHIHLHARAQSKYADADIKDLKSERRMSKQSMLALMDNLTNTVKKLKWNPEGTEWGDYYDITNYSETAFKQKKDLLSEWLGRVSPKWVWDLGANRGIFTRLASDQGIPSIAFDIDPAAVEQNYRQVRSEKEKHILPLVLDLTNPSPALGWHNRERVSFSQRGPADMVFSLALIHHLAISNNVPLTQLAIFFNDMGKWLVIEFVPKGDSQVQKLLKNRLDIFDHYTREDFEKVFSSQFKIHEKVKLRESERYLYLMESRE
jgi:ribosomal protein L11 methylase PrmA